MKKNHIILAIVLCIDIGIYAQPVTVDKALEIGVQFWGQRGGEIGKRAVAQYQTDRGSFTTKVLKQKGRDCLYVVSMPENGWVLVSGDERIMPIMAMSESGSFPEEDDMPPAMRNLLEDYANQVLFVQDSVPDAVAHPYWEALEHGTYAAQMSSIEDGNGSEIYTPGACLLNRPERGGEVQWSQNGPSCEWWNEETQSNEESAEYVYNKFCPDWYTPSCGRTYVGCTAVAMAQIMWYWQVPHTGYIPTGVKQSGKPVNSDRELHIYNWEMMPRYIVAPTKYTPGTPIEQVNMLTGFLRDCGYAAEMEYEADGSGCNNFRARNALINTFAYSNNISRKYKWLTSEWSVKLRQEINAGRPVLYAGDKKEGGGHAFVVDGYDKDNPYLFHINWGYSGDYNGYFVLDNMCPTACFNDRQEALFGIKPNPACGSYDQNGGKNLRIGMQGPVTVANMTVEAGETAVCYSGTSVRLLPGFRAKAGSNVHIAIQHFPCDGLAPAILRAPEQTDDEPIQEEGGFIEQAAQDFSISPNPTNGLLQITTSNALKNAALYSLNGEKVLETNDTMLELYGLSAGMYILHVQTTDGSMYQEKVIKQ